VAITPPIRLRQFAESFAIIDGAGVTVAYVYFDEAPERRAITKRLSKADAEDAAKTMAAAIRARFADLP
jgi:hypothetical protein